ncbi:EAL domain-containing protein [Iodobacter sp. HSC-16F04]|uniref:EAL domain-containing protein n=1 Tax=Iodobacter violaceini TaxID=3044271 RepID=A0ABX0L0I8_9NEIS|nr:EAL domain-containing protein [Iodobacter violacea]NHQ86028.1 EAL domain-containing protein [Iodobacter violacea]
MMITSLQRLSIRIQLFLLTLAITLPFVVMLGLFLNHELKQLHKEAYAKVQIIANNSASDIASRLHRYQQTLLRIASRPQVKALDPQHCDPLLKEFVQLSPEFTTLSLRDKNAQPICSYLSQPPSTRQLEQFPWFTEAIQTQHFTLGDADVGSSSGRWVAVLAQPVFNPALGGLLILPLDLLKFSKDVFHSTPAQTIITVIDQRNIIALHSGDAATWIGQKTKYTTSARPNELSIIKNEDGISRLNSFATVPGTKWRVFAGIPEAEVFAEYTQYLWYSLTLSIIFLILALLLAWRISIFIIQPISRLVRTARQVAEGDTHTRASVDGPLEIKAVAKQFNGMLDAWQHSEAVRYDSALHTQTILDNMADAVITINQRGIIESFNQAASAIFGYSHAEITGKNISLLMPEPHRSHHDSYLQNYQSSEARIIGVPREVEGLRKNGQLFPMSLSVSKINLTGRITFIGLIRDITQNRENEQEIRRLAFYDPLTGLANRRLLADRLRQAMITSARNGQHGALMFLDLDHFKQLNDNLGHDLGDLLLQQVAERLQNCVREGDSVARLGGDEFVVLLEELSTNPHEAVTQTELIASKILEELGLPYALNEHVYSSTPSIGIVLFLEDLESMEELLKKADVAMYQAKSAGRNTARFFDPVMQAAAAAHDESVRDLRRGFAGQEFVLQYQVQVDNNGEITGAEALVRWNHPERGLVAPLEFIPLAEETGIILPLGQWVLETACNQLHQWSLQPLTANWSMAVNVSALQFTQANFVEHVSYALKKTGVNPRKLKLELTESMLIDDIEDIIDKMNHLKKQGVSFSLDDFGTGYSSLSNLKQLPLDQLKIDQSFVQDIMSDPSDAIIARAIIVLGHSLGLKVIAEGVETQEQRDFLMVIGCVAFQGNYFGKPLFAHELNMQTDPGDAAASSI